MVRKSSFLVFNNFMVKAVELMLDGLQGNCLLTGHRMALLTCFFCTFRVIAPNLEGQYLVG